MSFHLISSDERFHKKKQVHVFCTWLDLTSSVFLRSMSSSSSSVEAALLPTVLPPATVEEDTPVEFVLLLETLPAVFPLEVL